MSPKLVTLEPMRIVGFEVRTSVREEMAPHTAKIIKLWDRFKKEQVRERICGENPTCPPVALFSKYESDYNGKFSLLAGVVAQGDDVPEGMTSVTTEGGQYLLFSGSGPMPKVWFSVWQGVTEYFSKKPQYKRAYTTDFEIYPAADKLDIHISVQPL